MAFHPASGWRHVTVTDWRTKQDFAEQMRQLVDVHFPDATLISVVLDNLNTHSPASLYATFAPAEAKRILNKLEFRYTPKHGSQHYAEEGRAKTPTSGPKVARWCPCEDRII
jgi:hypothetical protein